MCEASGCVRFPLFFFLFLVWASSEMECGFLSADGKADMIIL